MLEGESDCYRWKICFRFWFEVRSSIGCNCLWSGKSISCFIEVRSSLRIRLNIFILIFIIEFNSKVDSRFGRIEEVKFIINIVD